MHLAGVFNNIVDCYVLLKGLCCETKECMLCDNL